MLFTMPSWKHVVKTVHQCWHWNPPYKFKWTEKDFVPVTVGQIILTGIDNDIYSTVDACPNAYHNQLLPEIEEKEIDKLMALISLSFKKIYKPTNNNLRTSSNTSRANQENSLRINKGTGYDNQRAVNVAGARENVGTQIQEVTPDAADNSGPIFDTEPLHKVHNDNDNYNVFSNDREHYEKPDSVNDTYLEEQGDTNITIDSLDMSNNGETVDQDDEDLARERDFLVSLIEKLKYEINDNKNRSKFLESSNKALVEKIERYHDVNYASKVAIDCAKAKGDLMSYKMESEKSFNEYTRKINDLNQTILEMKKELFAHQETISIMSQEKEAQKKFHKTREDKELEKVIALENKIKVLDDIVYKTGQSVQTMNMLNRNCKTSFVKPEFLKKAQRANPRLYDIGCYNDNLALMLAPESDETIRVISTTSVSRPLLKSNQLEDRVMRNNSEGKKQQVKDHRRNFRFSNNKTSVTACNDSLNAKTSNVNFPIDVPISNREPKQTVNQFAATTLKRTVATKSTNQKPRRTIRKQYEQISKTCKWWYCKITPPGYKWKSKSRTVNVEPNLVEIILFIIDSGCSKYMTGNLKLLSNFVEKFLGTVKFGNDQIEPILGYGDLVQGNITIKRVCYVKWLNHNLFSIGQFYDADLEVAFRKSTCYIHDLKGNDLLTGSRGTDIYSMMT
ncbi:hypothetical protein Tco_0749613 [Tanacetum coccineum]|uniref:Retrovirus-related Pol polyprotein from transposon TNT 1-94-like beta-barrel domain-containing protein n=1 Tax=Tanacetum coccineum TaxID=301880 RepID=A0ABQ4YZR5_9ASTR